MAARHAFARELTGKIVQDVAEVITTGDRGAQGIFPCVSPCPPW